MIKGLEILNTGNGGIIEPKLPATLTNQVEGVPPHQFIRTIDPRLAIHNLPTYPLLPASTDSRRLEEIRRTLVIMNLDPTFSASQVVDFFCTAGEVKYFRMCSRETDNIQYGLINLWNKKLLYQLLSSITSKWVIELSKCITQHKLLLNPFLKTNQTRLHRRKLKRQLTVLEKKLNNQF